MKKQMTVRKTVLAALFLAIGLILPFITMQIPAVGRTFYQGFKIKIQA